MLSNGTTNIDSVTNFRAYVARAKELQMNAICFTEHGNIFEWLHKKEEVEKAGMKYIHGVEAYITESIEEKKRDNYHCILIAKNYDGVLELNQLVSESYNRMDGHFYYMPRILYDDLEKTSDNIIISTACLGGILHKGNENIKNRFIEFLKSNRHRCFLEIQHHIDNEQKEYNQYLYMLSKSIGVPLIAGTDTHALNEEHLEGRSILQKAKNVFFADEESWDLTFKSYDELVNAYEKQGSLPMDVVKEAIRNTNVLADMVEPFEIDRSYKYPHLWENPMKTFQNKIMEGIKKRGVDQYPNYQEYIDRIKHELKAYEHNGAIDFMLLMEDMISWCIKNDIMVGYGRGSVNGSVIAWLLGITEMDSIKHNLNFERFMNTERVSLSDIDTDFPPSKIEEVKQYIFSKTGLYCCDIVTFNTVADKGAIRDVGRAQNIPLSEVATICDSVDNEELFKKTRAKYKELFKYVDLIKGTIVSVGSHPCFLEDELVLTDCGYKEIKDVSIGDKVITHKGNLKEVCEVMVNESDDIYQVNTTFLPIKATGNHPFLVRERDDIRLRKYKNGVETTVRNYSKPKWKVVSQLKKGDMLGTPINQKSVIPMLEFDLDFSNLHLWWLIGRYIGDGWITDISGRNESYLVICCNKDNDETCDIVKRLVLLQYQYRIEERESVNRIYIYNNELISYLRRYGKYAYGKYLPYEVFDLPCDLLQSFLDGYISADGCFSQKENEYIYTTVSKRLALGISLCVSKVYKTFTKCQIVKAHTEKILGRRVNCKEKYIVKFHLNRRKLDRSFYENGFVWSYCYGINYIDINEKTYNLSVYDDNSYTVNNMAVHNCGCVVAPFSVANRFGTFTTSTSNYPISQINMKEIDSLNYVKLDLLRLDTIELINDTCKLAGINRLTPDNVDITDIEVWNAIRDDTTQIFQWEGKTGDSYIKKLLSEENIKKFQKVNENVDRMTLLSIGNSAIRPAGASYRDDLASGVVRKTGSKPIDEFLSNTFGYLVFQEQIISFLHQYCGFTMGEADIVRRGFAKKTGTDKYIPIIKNGGYLTDNSDHYIKGYIATMKEEYSIDEEKSEEDIVSFIQVIEDASSYLFSLNHSQPYSYEGYVSGYLRTYYPLEFLTTALNINKDKEEKTIGLTNYAKKIGIPIKSPKFRYSKAEYFCDQENKCIYKGVGAIKYMNAAIADELYSLKDKSYDNFIDVLVDIRNTSLNSRQLEILIKLDFFSEFGGIEYLLACYTLFNKYYGKKQIKKEKAFEDGLDFDMIRKYADKETTKMFSVLDSIGMLNELIAAIPNENTSIRTKISYQLENLGYIDIIDKKYAGYCVVVDLNLDFSPKLKLYALANGNLIPVKIDRKTFANKQLRRGDIIKVENQYRKNKMRKVDGKWTETDEKEWWLSEYRIC